MIIVNDLEQGSNEWLMARCGVITASRSKEFSAEASLAPLPDGVLITKDGKINTLTFGDYIASGTNKTVLMDEFRKTLPRVYPEMRQSYLNSLIAEVCTGEPKVLPDFKQLKWGKENESEARTAFELISGLSVSEVGFIYKDKSNRAGISPDGLNEIEKFGLELRCPFDTATHINFIVSDKIKPEYIDQCQFSMWVTGFERWYFASYDPRMPKMKMHIREIKRDDSYIQKYESAYEKFVDDMNAGLELIGIEFGHQWDGI